MLNFRKSGAGGGAEVSDPGAAAAFEKIKTAGEKEDPEITKMIEKRGSDPVARSYRGANPALVGYETMIGEPVGDGSDGIEDMKALVGASQRMNVTPEALVKMLAESGISWMKFGIESGIPRGDLPGVVDIFRQRGSNRSH